MLCLENLNNFKQIDQKNNKLFHFPRPPEDSLESHYCFWDCHLQNCICTSRKEDNTSKEEDEDINEDKEVKIVLVAAKNLDWYKDRW